MDAAEETATFRLMLAIGNNPAGSVKSGDLDLAELSGLQHQWFLPTADRSKRLSGKTSGMKVRRFFTEIDGRLYKPGMSVKVFIPRAALERLVGRITPVVRARIFARDGRVCCDCGATQDLSIDHIKPVCKGGMTVDGNLRVMCRTCNSKKGARSIIGPPAHQSGDISIALG